MGGRSNNGRVVTHETAMTISATWACWRVLSETVASLPIDIMRKTPKGAEVDRDHPLYELIAHEPARFYTSFTWRETMMIHGLAHGTCYSIIKRNGRGEPVEIIHVKTTDVTAVLVPGAKEQVYKIRGHDRTFTIADILAIPIMSYNGIAGGDMINNARNLLGEVVAAQEFGANYLGNGAMLSGILKSPNEVNKEARERIAESWNKKYHGSGNAGKTALLEFGMDYQAISSNANDAQLVELRRFYNEEVARFYNVPPHMIQDLTRSTNNNIEQQSIDFVRYTLRPYIKRWEQELNRKLFAPSQRSKNWVRFNIDGLLRGDSAARAELYKSLFSIKAITPNEVRELEGLNRLELPGMDDTFHPLNHVKGDGTEKTE